MGTKLNHQQFMEYFNQRDDHNDYEVLSEYTKMSDKMLFKHKKCGHEFLMKAGNFIHNHQGCPNCISNKPYSHDDIVKIIEKEGNGEYHLLSEYKNSKDKLTILHDKCGKTWKITFSDFHSGGYRCPTCAKNKKLTLEEIITRVPEIDKEYSLTNNTINKELFSNVHSKIWFKHNNKNCNNIFLMNFNNFRNGQRCPYCSNLNNTSKAVKNLINFMNNKNIKFEMEVTFDDLINPQTGKKLKIDFYLPEYDVYLEYDGKQHFEFEENGIFTESKFYEIKYRDSLKDEYAKRNSLDLVRIPYNVNEIDFLKKMVLNRRCKLKGSTTKNTSLVT